MAFIRLGSQAVKLLIDLVAQYRGNNNGDLTIAWKVMNKRGWRSRDTLEKARKELLAGNWIEITRQGGRHCPTLYALTFYAIDECGGKLDVRSTTSPKSTWRQNEPVPPLKPLQPNKIGVPPAVTLFRESTRPACQLLPE